MARAGWRPRRDTHRRALARALAAILVVIASLSGLAQRATAAGCAGRATVDVFGSAAAAAAAAAPGATIGTATHTATPPASPAEAPQGVAACGGSAALPIATPSRDDSARGRHQPADRATILRGAEAPEPLLGPPRRS